MMKKEKDEVIKVEFADKNKKAKSLMIMMIKFMQTIMLISIFVVIAEITTVISVKYTYEFIANVSIFNVELSTFGNIIRTPFIILLTFVPLILPSLLIINIVKYVITKFNLSNDKMKKQYLTFLFISLILIIIGVYLQGW